MTELAEPTAEGVVRACEAALRRVARVQPDAQHARVRKHTAVIEPSCQQLPSAHLPLYGFPSTLWCCGMQVCKMYSWANIAQRTARVYDLVMSGASTEGAGQLGRGDSLPKELARAAPGLANGVGSAGGPVTSYGGNCDGGLSHTGETEACSNISHRNVAGTGQKGTPHGSCAAANVAALGVSAPLAGGAGGPQQGPPSQDAGARTIAAHHSSSWDAAKLLASGPGCRPRVQRRDMTGTGSDIGSHPATPVHVPPCIQAVQKQPQGEAGHSEGPRHVAADAWEPGAGAAAALAAAAAGVLWKDDLVAGRAALLPRLTRYHACGGWAGRFFCLIAILLHLWWHVLVWLQPATRIDPAIDWPRDTPSAGTSF